MSPQRKKSPPARFLYGGPDDESFSAKSALDYLHEKYVETDCPAGFEEEVAKYERKPFALEAFRRAIEAEWQDILTALDDEYAVDDPIGLEDLEEDFVEKAALLLFKMARRDCVSRQCELREVQTWTWDGNKWRRT